MAEQEVIGDWCELDRGQEIPDVVELSMFCFKADAN
jgi:hypothetical protein